jgi:hypothetical protein
MAVQQDLDGTNYVGSMLLDLVTEVSRVSFLTLVFAVQSDVIGGNYPAFGRIGRRSALPHNHRFRELCE